MDAPKLSEGLSDFITYIRGLLSIITTEELIYRLTQQI